MNIQAESVCIIQPPDDGDYPTHGTKLKRASHVVFRIILKIRSSARTIWAASALIALINRLIYTLTIACLPDILQNKLHVPRQDNGIITASFGIGGLIAGLGTGYISDKMRNRVVLQGVAALIYIVSGIVFYFSSRFYHIVMFRFVLGIGSTIADLLLFTTVADVFPSNLLGFKMAVLFAFDNIGNMIGPVIGGILYDNYGIDAIASFVIALGVFEFVGIAVFVRNSLDIRADTLAKRGHIQSSYDELCRDNVSVGESAHIEFSGTVTSNMAINPLDGKQHNEPCASLCYEETADAKQIQEDTECGAGSTVGPAKKKPHIFRIALQIPVIGSTMAIFTGTGLQSVIETVVPLRLSDKFGYNPEKIGIAMLIVGAILSVSMPIVGLINDRVIGSRGEHMRYYAIAMGLFLMSTSLIIVSIANVYIMLLIGYAGFAITAMVVIVPAQSAFGDYINSEYCSEGEDSVFMAQSYSLASIAEGIANIALPPIATGLYSSIGFTSMLVALTIVLSVICTVAVLAYPVRSALCAYRGTKAMAYRDDGDESSTRSTPLTSSCHIAGRCSSTFT